jgi:ATP adenylyltransferase
MKLLYAPWRSSYSSAPHESRNRDASSTSCVFCTQLQENRDEYYFIIKRYTHVFVTMNRYPYNAGHIMVLPLAHKAQLHEMSREAQHELMDILSLSIQVMKNSLKADAVNAGLNLGKVSGGSIAHHVHMHVVPRWEGDTNFMPTTSDSKVISFDMREIYTLLKQGFDQ